MPASETGICTWITRTLLQAVTHFLGLEWDLELCISEGPHVMLGAVVPYSGSELAGCTFFLWQVGQIALRLARWKEAWVVLQL